MINKETKLTNFKDLMKAYELYGDDNELPVEFLDVLTLKDKLNLFNNVKKETNEMDIFMGSYYFYKDNIEIIFHSNYGVSRLDLADIKDFLRELYLIEIDYLDE